MYGATILVLAPDHPLVASLTTASRRAEVEAFAARMAAMGKIERTAEDAPKEGVFTGAYAINPFTGQPVPIWVANFVLSDYGTGALMAVPAHDSRDFAFARKYGLPIKPVVQPGGRPGPRRRSTPGPSRSTTTASWSTRGSSPAFPRPRRAGGWAPGSSSKGWASRP